MKVPERFSSPDSVAGPVSLRLPVAWGELDALGHVNHTVYLRWIESARMAWFERVGVAAYMRESDGRFGPILVRAECEYRAPVGYPDTIWVNNACTRIGTSSLRLDSEIWSESAEAIVARGRVVVVCIDYVGGGRPVPVPEPVRAAVRALDGAALDAAEEAES